GKDVSVARIYVSSEVLAVDRLASPRSRTGKERPIESTVCIACIRPDLADVAIKKIDCVLSNLRALRARELLRDAVRWDRVRQYTAEVRDRTNILGKALFRYEMGHVGPGIERLDESRQVDRRMRPAKLCRVGANPELECLRRH